MEKFQEMSRYSRLKNKVFKIQQPEGQTKFNMTNQFDTEGKYRILQHLILLLSKYTENYVCNFLFYSYEIFKSFLITSYSFYLSILTFLSLSDIAVTLSLPLIQITNFLMGFLSPMIVPSDLPSLIFPGWNALSKFKYVIIFLHRHFHHCLRTMDEPRFLSWFTGSLTSFVNPSPPLSDQSVHVVWVVWFPHEENLFGYSTSSLRVSFITSLDRRTFIIKT